MQIAESLKRRLFEHEEGTRGALENIHPRAGNKVSADVDDRDSCWPRDAELRDGWKQKRAEFASLLCKGGRGRNSRIFVFPSASRISLSDGNSPGNGKMSNAGSWKDCSSFELIFKSSFSGYDFQL